MLRRSTRGVAREVRTLFVAGATRDLTDGQLLERFAAGRGEASERAFATLVERHGPMVLRVSRGVLPDPNDAHDVFQATFLVLVKKARRLWVRESLGPWLHQVAYRTACRARADAARRRRHEGRSAEAGRLSTSRPSPADDQGRLIHAEIERLPERFRVPVVLCDLEGRSHEQAARHVGCPVGTLKSRLSRGRDRLRDRLTRLGVGPAAVGLPAAPVPPSLADATTAAALRFDAPGALARGTAATLAKGVLRAMNVTHFGKVASLVVALGATAASVSHQAGQREVAPSQTPPPIPAARAADAPVVQARRGPLKVTVSGHGSLESSRNADAYCRVEGQTRIIAIVPEGTKVKKGEKVCELDSSALRDQLVNQRIATRGAEFAYQQAKLDREIAEIAVVEYLDGIYKSEKQTIEGELALARDGMKWAEAKLKRTQKARQAFDASAPRDDDRKPSDVILSLNLDDRLDEAELNREQKTLAIEMAQTRLDVLQKYIKPKTVMEIQARVEQAKSKELDRKANWDLEKTKEAKLGRMIEFCVLIATADGILVYANNPNRTEPGGLPQVEEGGTVRERQKIFSVLDLKSFRITVRVPEAVIDRVVPGQPARVSVDAFSQARQSGKVVEVQTLPDPQLYATTGRKLYLTRVEISDPLPGLRPGMSGEAEILCNEREDVVTVPVGAIVTSAGQDRVAVKTPDGFVWRDVTLGLTDDSVIEVRKGLDAGEYVAFEPAKLLADEAKATPAKTAPPAR